ncbi:hypothetical protein CAAN1_03S01068 [[Candida] anglica]|uniref:Gamma-tubulin complex component n=1 Tax=[Candida] anglica TaxID=148631 RepID=A0ABP0EGJ3_9ASCO
MEGKKSKYLMTITLNNIKSMNYKLWGYCDSNLLFEVFQAISITVKKILMCWILDNKGILYVQDPTRDPNMLKVIQSTLKGTLNHSFAGLEYGLKGSRANDNHIIRSIGSLGGGQSLLLMKHYLELLSKLSVKISQDFPDDIDDTRLSVLSHLIVLNYSELTSTYLKLKWF